MLIHADLWADRPLRFHPPKCLTFCPGAPGANGDREGSLRAPWASELDAENAGSRSAVQAAEQFGAIF